MDGLRIPISHHGVYRHLATALGARHAALEVRTELDAGGTGASFVTVTYGPWFRARFARTTIASVVRDRGRVISRGVHGWRGRWLVNGAGTGLVRIALDPEQRARLFGIRIRLVELVVSVDDPDALVTALGG